MITCKKGLLQTINKPDGKVYYRLRANLIDDEKEGRAKYIQKHKDTDLLATPRNKKRAEQLLADFISENNQSGSNVYLSNYCDHWLENKRLEIELDTYEGYICRYKYIKQYFDENHKTLQGVTRADILSFYRYLLFEVPNSRNKTGVGLSRRTVKDIKTLLSQMLKDAVLDELISHNPCESVKLPNKVEDAKNNPYISANQVPIFLEAIKGHPLENAFKLAIICGLRRSEVAGLKWDAVRNGHIYIEHVRTRHKTEEEKNRTKTTAGHRNYPITRQIQELLNEVKKQQDCNRKKYGKNYIESGYIFTQENGKQFRLDYFTKQFKKIVSNTPELDNDLHLHSLRNSCINMLIHSGLDVKNVQEWVGHSDISTTLNIYASVNEEEKTKISQAMSALLLGSFRTA
jgi:integrase